MEPWCWNHKKWAQHDVITASVSRETVRTPREMFHVKHSCAAASRFHRHELVRWTRAAGVDAEAAGALAIERNRCRSAN